MDNDFDNLLRDAALKAILIRGADLIYQFTGSDDQREIFAATARVYAEVLALKPPAQNTI